MLSLPSFNESHRAGKAICCPYTLALLVPQELSQLEIPVLLLLLLVVICAAPVADNAKDGIPPSPEHTPWK
jgi:hypothetical protein